MFFAMQHCNTSQKDSTRFLSNHIFSLNLLLTESQMFMQQTKLAQNDSINQACSHLCSPLATPM